MSMTRQEWMLQRRLDLQQRQIAGLRGALGTITRNLGYDVQQLATAKARMLRRMVPTAMLPQEPVLDGDSGNVEYAFEASRDSTLPGLRGLRGVPGYGDYDPYAALNYDEWIQEE